MKKMTLHRLGAPALLLAAAAIAVPSAAQAQNDLQVRYFAAPGYAGEGMPYRDCGMEFQEEDDGFATAPVDVTRLDSGLTPQQAEQQRQQLRTELLALVDEFESMLATMPPDYPNRPTILFRQAEAYRELADADHLVAYAQFSECVDNWYQCVSDAECYEPMPDYTDATAAYAAIARNHPNYERLDEVVFRLGETLMENDDAAQGIQYLTRLVNTYPDSQFIPDARFMMGEHYFDSDILSAARQNYEDVLNYQSSSLYNVAMWKIGWVDINEAQYEDALTRFQQVVQNLSMVQNDALDFRTQALNDMLLAYVELDNGWQRARDYYLQAEDEDFMRRKLAQLANLYDEQGKDESRIEVLAYFMDNWPSDSRVPQWMEQTLDSLGKIGNWDRTEAQAREFIAALEPTGPWALQNQSNSRELTNARINTENWLLMIISRNDSEARRINNDLDQKRDLFVEVEEDYRQFFQRFPDSEDIYEHSFYYAELLYYQLGNEGECDDHEFLTVEPCEGYLQNAGDQYRQVVEMNPDPEAPHAHDSAIGALSVYDFFMSRDNPRVDDPLPAPGEYDEFFGEPTELNATAQNYVDIVEWFSDLYPEDDLIPAASWRAASLYLYASQVANAANRFETIIEHHPEHRFAQNAALAAFVCYNHVEDWPNIEYVARRLLESCEGDTRICEVDSLQSAIAYSMNNQAEDLMEAGRASREEGAVEEANELFLQAADKRVELYREFPDSEWSPDALANAAATYETAREIDTSIELFEEFLERFPEHERVAEAIFTLGLIHDSVAEFDQAATWFERLVEEYPSDANAPDALINAGRLREALSDYDTAIAHYEAYQALGVDEEVNKEIYFQIANIELDRDNPDAAYDRLESFLDDVTDDPERRITAAYMQAEIRREQGNMDAALTKYGQVYSMYGVGEPAYDENNQWAGWTTEPGANFTGERNAVLPLVAEAAFWDADQAFMVARNADLEYPVGRTNVLTDKLVARGEAIVEAEKAMFAVFNMGDAQWAVAAGTRIGQLYKDFYRDLYDVPPPDYDQCLDLTYGDYDACDEMIEEFDGLLFQYGEQLEDKAMAAWVAALDTARSLGIYTDWTQLLIEEMNDSDRSYRLGGAEGVVASNSSDAYITTRYILDLEDKLEAFEDWTPPTPMLGPDGLPIEGGMMAPAGGTMPADGAMPAEGAAPAEAPAEAPAAE